MIDNTRLIEAARLEREEAEKYPGGDAWLKNQLADALEVAEKRLQWYTDVLMCRFAPELEIREGQALHGRRFVEEKQE